MKKITTAIVLAFMLILFKPVLSKAQTYVPLLRYYNSSAHKHIICTNPNELGNGAYGYVYERTIGYIYGGSANQNNIYRWVNTSTGAHYCTGSSTTAPSGFSLEGVLGNDQALPVQNININIYEYYSATFKDYLYTEDPSKENLTSYKSNGVSFGAFQNN